MQTALSRAWIRVAVPISYDDNRYITSDSHDVYECNILYVYSENEIYIQNLFNTDNFKRISADLILSHCDVINININLFSWNDDESNIVSNK